MNNSAATIAVPSPHDGWVTTDIRRWRRRWGRYDFGERLPTLQAERVRLRWLVDADVPGLFAVFGDPEVTRFWGFATLPDLAAAAALLADIHARFAEGCLLQWRGEVEGSLSGRLATISDAASAASCQE